ncbi:MAG: hypothetical protein M5U34_21795 [Chloroflexi bacterium]|nr:hypothetical protein [Chloroflexota bacterium]
MMPRAGGSVTLNPGSGGDGGWVTANGGDGNDDCTTAQNGANAKAQSGNGGKASKTAVVSGNVVGIGNIVVTGGMGVTPVGLKRGLVMGERRFVRQRPLVVTAAGPKRVAAMAATPS